MEKFDIDENLKMIRQIMRFMGTWPERSSCLKYKLKGSMTILLITLFTITTVAQALKFTDIESTSFALCCFMASFHSMIKYFFLFTKKSQLFELMQSLKEPILSLHEPHLNVYFIRKMKMCRSSQLVLLFSAVGTGILVIISPLVEKHSERPLPVPFLLDMKKQSLLVYVLVWWYESVPVIFTTLSVACFDGLLFTFISIAAAQLKIVREKIIHSTNHGSAEFQTLKDRDVRVIIQLKQCVIKHLAVERYISSIENIFTNGFLIQLIISLLITCLIGFNLVLIPVTSINFGRCILFFVAASTELIMFCVSGNEIILQSEKIRDACYMCDWVSFGVPVRKTLLIIMERSKRTFNLTAANFVVLSLETLMSIFKSAFSYFTVLRKMYGDAKQI